MAEKGKTSWRAETALIHGGHQRTRHGETAEALFLTSGYRYESAAQAEARFKGEEEGYIYTRYGNPTVRVFEERMMALEGAAAAKATASGMAAVTAAFLSSLKAGDHLIAARALFGSCRYVVETVLPRFGIEVSLIDGAENGAWEKAIRPNSRALFLETPTNPRLDILDLSFIGGLAKSQKLRLIVDNVFATPFLQKPLLFGAEIVVYSATKHIDGQGRALAGIILGSEEYVEEELAPFYRNTGPALSPFNAWLMLKSLETLPIRMKAHCQRAETLARFLESQSAVKRVFYPGLASHPGRALAKKQMSLPGALLAFEMGSKRDAFRLMDNLRIIGISNNLGDAKSLIVHPATTTHSRLSEEARLEIGVSDRLLRLSAGLEHAEDLKEDLSRALSSLR